TQKFIATSKNRSLSWEKRAEQLIDAGLKKLNLELGIISHIIGDKYTIIYSNNSELIGKEFNLGVTYCQITMSMVSNTVVAIENFAVTEHFRHPAYKEFKLETYIASPIISDRKRLGTINFTMPERRLMPFSAYEKDLVYSLSKDAGIIVLEATTKV
ncbi:MAG: GAF domain-containing protein, partial [Chloroflexota bacterium]